MKHLRNVLVILLSLIIATALPLTAGGCAPETSDEVPRTVKIGILKYRTDDTFIDNVCEWALKEAKKIETETGDKLIVNIQSAQNNQNLQNDQVERMIQQEYDIICVNPVDRTMASGIINKARRADVPVIFFNREPVKEDMTIWEHAYYIGTDAKESGRLQGELFAQFVKMGKIRPNTEGEINFVIIEGEPNHQDTLLRSEYSVREAAELTGIPLRKLDGTNANWERGQSEMKMSQWIDRYGDRIEVVLANNDEMAIGAVQAYENRGVPLMARPVIFGIDATRRGMEVIATGAMAGTVVNDYREMGQSLIRLGVHLAAGETKPFPGLEGQYIRIPHFSVTSINLASTWQYLTGTKLPDDLAEQNEAIREELTGQR